MRSVFRVAVPMFVLAILAAAGAEAAPQVPATATLRGIVRDVTGGVLPGAIVTAAQPATGISRAVLTTPQGQYELTGLPPGTWEVDAALPGFATGRMTVVLAGGSVRVLEFTLAIETYLESVIVTRAGEAQGDVPQAVTVVGGPEIQFGQRRDLLAESLRGTPGLFIENRRNYSLSGGINAAIRAPMVGFDMRGITILQDGIPLTTADGTTQATNLDMGSAARIEVVRGPSSVLYGNSAGGVISVETEFPSASALVIEPDVQVGSYGYDRLQMKAGGTSGRFSYLANLSRLDVEGFRDNSSAEIVRANVVMRFAASPRTDVQGMFNLYDQPFARSPSTLTELDARERPTSVRPQALTQGWGEDAAQGQGGVTIEHAFDSGYQLSATGWGQWRSVWNPVPFRIIDLGRRAGGLRTVLRGSRDVSGRPVSWTAGLDLSVQRDERIEYVNAGVPAGELMTTEGDQLLGQDEAVTSFAPFLRARLELDDRWALTAGFRYDYFKFSAADNFLSDGDQSGGRTMDAFSPMVGATFQATPEVNLYANFATAYQTPTTVELSNRPTGEGGFNDRLEPEDLRSLEFGARGSLPESNVRFEIATYFSTLDNAFVELQRPDEQTYFANAAASSRNGLELQLSWSPRTDIDATLGYAYQDFTFDRYVTDTDNFSGNREPGAPAHQLFLSGTYLGEGGFRSTLQYRWIAAFPVNNANTFENWASHVVDVRLGWERPWREWTLRPFLGIENLFDQRYNSSTIPNSFGNRFYEPSPGREFLVGLTVRGSVR